MLVGRRRIRNILCRAKWPRVRTKTAATKDLYMHSTSVASERNGWTDKVNVTPNLRHGNLRSGEMREMTV